MFRRKSVEETPSESHKMLKRTSILLMCLMGILLVTMGTFTFIFIKLDNQLWIGSLIISVALLFPVIRIYLRVRKALK